MKLNAQMRTETGTRASKKVRREGSIPAAIYGSSVDTVSVVFNRREFETILREVGANGVFTIDVEGGEEYQVFVKDQTNAAIKDEVYHIDLQAFLKGEKVVMDIPVYLEGEAELEDAVANQALTEIQIEVAPASAPSEYYVNVADLEIGDSITVADMELEGDIEVITEADTTVVSISAPEEIIEEEPDADAEMPEPELIGADDDEEEEE